MTRRSAASWGALLAFAVISALPFTIPTAFAAGGVADSQVSPNADISAYKIKGYFASDAAYVNAQIAECQRTGTRYAVPVLGESYWNTTIPGLRYCNAATCAAGGAWATYAPGLGAGQTLAVTYSTGAVPADNVITRTDADGSVQITDTAAGSVLSSFVVARSAGSGAAINIDNTGSGPDIQGDLWAVDTSGFMDIQRVDLGDNDPVRFGDSQDMAFSWNATLFLVDGLTDSYQISWDTDQHGLDQLWYADSGAGAGMFYDASDPILTFIDAHLKLTDSDRIYLGTATGTGVVDGDFEVYYDGSDLYFFPLVPGDGIIYGQGDGLGVDVTWYGDAAGNYLKWDYSAAGDSLQIAEGVVQPATIQVLDAAGLAFGTGAGPEGDIQLSYTGGTNILGVTQTAAGVGTITWGVNDKGITHTFYTETGGSYFSLDQANDQLLANVANIHLNDTARIVWGTGAPTVLGDMSLALSAGHVLSLLQTAAGTGTFDIGVSGTGIDTTFHGETAADYMRWDQDVGAGEAALLFVAGPDIQGDANFAITMGATDPVLLGSGITISSTATEMSLNPSDLTPAGTEALNIGDLRELNFSLWGTGPSEDIVWDWVDETLVINGTGVLGVNFTDADALTFGSGAAANGDVDFVWETVAVVPAADSLHVELAAGAAAADQNFVFGTDAAANNIDVYFLSGTTGEYLRWDNSASALSSVGALFTLQDGSAADDAILFGTLAGGEVRAFWREAGNSLDFDPGAAGSVITLGRAAGAAPLDVLWSSSGTSSLTLDDDNAGGANPFASYVRTYSNFDETSILYFDAAAAALPADGFAMYGNSAGASDLLYIYSVAGAAADGVVVGYTGAAASPTDLTLYGNNGGGADVAEVLWDYSEDHLVLSGSAGIHMDDNLALDFGNTVAAPDAVISFDTADLAIEVDGANVHFGKTTDTNVRFDGAAGDLIWDDGNADLLAQDGVQVLFGTGAGGGDVAFTADGTGLDIDNAWGAGAGINVGSNLATNWTFTTGAGTAVMDSAANSFTFTGVTIDMADDVAARFGSGAGSDAQIQWDNVASQLQMDANGFAINVSADFNTDFIVTTAGGNVTIDDGNNTMTLTGVTLIGGAGGNFLPDDATLGFGNTYTAPRVTMEWDTVLAPDGFLVTAAAGTDFVWGSTGVGLDHIFWMADAGDYIEIDATANALNLEDSNLVLNAGSYLYVGTANEAAPADGFSFISDGTNINIQQVAVTGGEVRIGQANDTDFHLYGAAGSGFDWDYGLALAVIDEADLRFNDMDYALFGDASDVSFSWQQGLAGYPGAADALQVVGLVANTPLYLGVNGSGLDVAFFADTADDWLFWDQNTEALFSAGVNTILDTDSTLFIGSNNALAPNTGMQISGNGTHLNLDSVAGVAGHVQIGSAQDTDFTVEVANGTIATDYGNNTLIVSDGGNQFAWDADTDLLHFTGVDIQLDNNDLLYFGDTPSWSVDYDAGTTNNLFIDAIAGADDTLQLGTSAANHDVELLLADNTRGISISANNTLGTAITYLGTATPQQTVWIPAGSFVPGSTPGAAAEGVINTMSGWLLDASGTECMQTTVDPDMWWDTASDITAFVVYAPANGVAANEVLFRLSRFQIVPGTTLTTAVDGGPEDYLETVVQDTVGVTAGFTIDNSLVTPLATAPRPIYLDLCRIGGDGTDDFAGDVAVMGIKLVVTRRYGD